MRQAKASLLTCRPSQPSLPSLPLLLLLLLLLLFPSTQTAPRPQTPAESTVAPGLWLRSPDTTPPAAASSSDFRTERYHISELFEQV